ncbi:MAG: hypothetical protein ACRDQ5_04915 [Sciscionella sp.]
MAASTLELGVDVATSTRSSNSTRLPTIIEPRQRINDRSTRLLLSGLKFSAASLVGVIGVGFLRPGGSNHRATRAYSSVQKKAKLRSLTYGYVRIIRIIVGQGTVFERVRSYITAAGKSKVVPSPFTYTAGLFWAGFNATSDCICPTGDCSTGHRTHARIGENVG